MMVHVGQKRIDVVDPETGKPGFIVATLVGDRILIPKNEMIKYRFLGITERRYQNLVQHGIIGVYSGNGRPRASKKQPPYIDIDELIDADSPVKDKADDTRGFEPRPMRTIRRGDMIIEKGGRKRKQKTRTSG